MKVKTKTRKILKIAIITVGSIIILGVMSFIPTFSLKTPNMNVLQGEFVTVYYEKEELAARDVFEVADSHSEYVATSLGFDEPQDISIYIYDNQSTFQRKIVGPIALFFNRPWFIGAMIEVDVLLTSPADAFNTSHDYNGITYTVVHEMVHVYNSMINKKMPLWINEGLAKYLSDQVPRKATFGTDYFVDSPQKNLYNTSDFVPTIKDMQTADSLSFANMNGYPFSFTYIEYLKKAYGWDKVKAFANSPDYNYNEIFGASEDEIYKGWIRFLQENYNE